LIAPALDVGPEAAAALLSEPGARLLDVRTPGEWETARIEGAVLLDAEVARAIREEWPREAPVVVYCHHGIRSRSATVALRRAGFARAVNLAGGIEEWSKRVDPAVPRY
jgi:rhodanese-related sulfurtransferase